MGELRAGATFGGYRLVSELGRGGMGVVFRAREVALDREVALKVIAPNLLDSDWARLQFVRETRAAAAIEHVNVIPIYSAGHQDGTAYLAMRLVDGFDLRSLVRVVGPLAAERAAGLVMQVAAALDAAHAAGLVHLDVKPANVLVALDDHAYLTDFGLAARARHNGTAATPGAGTTGYMAPEVLAGAEVDRRADVYSLACLLAFALTGTAPAGQPPDGLPSALVPILRRALADDPAARHASAGELARAAAAALTVAPEHAGMQLLEREAELELLRERLERVERTGQGRIVLLEGEAGVGKTALLRAFRDAQGVRTVEGACEALFTARPLGPVLDIAADLGGQVAELVEGSPAPADVVRALANELRSPHLILLEDLHWADEATLDVLRLLIRRVRTMPALVIATFRDDEVGPAHPLRRVLGEARGEEIERVVVEPLSEGAVAELAAGSGIDPGRLYATTGGNAFFVTEVLASGEAGDAPETVRDAVRARTGRLDASSRRLLEAIAIVPPRVELWLLERVSGADFAQIAACLATGIVRAERDAVSFRHELARTTIEADLAPDRAVELHRAVLAALGDRADPARLAHHAEAAHDRSAAHTYAVAAAKRAASLGAHHEAVAQYERALRHAPSLTPTAEAELLERLSYERYLTGRIDEALTAGASALGRYRETGDLLRQGDTLRWMSRLAWNAGDNERANRHAVAAVRLLEPLPAGRELALAYSNASQLRMLSSDAAGAVEWGERAIALAERLGETEILAHATINVGSAALNSGRTDEGWELLARGGELADAAGLEDDAARAHVNAACIALNMRELDRADEQLEAGMTYCREHDLDGYHHYLIGWSALRDLLRGRWDSAQDTAAAAAARTGMAVLNRIVPLTVLGLLRARRGEGDPWAPLDEAWELAASIGELMRLAPVSAARAEVHWLSGKPEAVAEATAAAVTLIEQGADAPWQAADVLLWRLRAGAPLPDVRWLSAPHVAERNGDPAGAARLWRQLGCPYEAALALAGSEHEQDLRAALTELRQLGANAAAKIVARRLRERAGGGRPTELEPQTRTLGT